MREHRQEHATKGGRSEWLERAHAHARRNAWLGNMGQRPDRIETREEFRNGKLAAIVAESRVDVTVPTALKDRVKEVFIKANTAVELQGDIIVDTRLRSRVLVVVFKQVQNGIRGLPVTPAEGRKLRKEGFTHVVITSVPEGARERETAEALEAGRYDESGWWMGFYKPKGGHVHSHEKGGELVREFRSELFVLQYLYENDLADLFGVQLLTSWGFLPKTDDMREAENTAAAQLQLLFGRPQRLQNPERSYHRKRLMERFCVLLRESAVDKDDLAAKVNEVMSETVIGPTMYSRVEDGTLESRAYYLALDDSIAYSIHNSSQGQMVAKFDLQSRTVEVGLTKVGLNGLALMSFYDDFLTSNRFRQVSWEEFSAHTAGIGVVDLNRSDNLAPNAE
ncbi:MAG: hypothetical protein WC551_06870 [Patescibacteria group bacterium]